jgi:hypothetical protein
VTIQLPQDLASLIEDAVRSGRYDREDDVIRDALLRLTHGLASPVSTSETVEIEPPGEHLPDRSSRQDQVETGTGNPSQSAGPKLVAAGGPPVDVEGSISEVTIREHLIEWLIGFLADDPRTS